MSVFPSSRSVIPASQPQRAALSQSSPVDDTWYDVLDYTGSGFLFVAWMSISTSTNIGVELRITIDGGTSVVFEDDGSIVRDYLGFITGTSGAGLNKSFFRGVCRFTSSLQVEARRTSGSGNTLRALVEYSTDI